MSHTPGPWTAEQVGDTGGENPVDVFEITNGYKRIAEYVTDADARLIAAAPDLLEALEAIVARDSEHFDAIGKTHYGPFAEIALAAIKKARGE